LTADTPRRTQRFFARFEFADDPHLLCCSDANPLSMRELLELADDDAKARWDALSLCYSESQGAPALREEIAKFYGAPVKPEHVLCCVPQEGILLAHALLTPGQHVVVTAPGYQSLYSLAKAMGCAASLAVRCKRAELCFASSCEVTPWLPTRSATGKLSFEASLLASLPTRECCLLTSSYRCPASASWCDPTPP
jgi:hypothetical protein